MPRMSAKKKRERRDTDKPRRELREEAGECMNCGRTEGLATHEIAGGGSRCKAVYLPRLQAVLCERCHKAWHNAKDWPPRTQIAAVFIFYLGKACVEYCDIKGCAPSHVTPKEVVADMATFV